MQLKIYIFIQCVIFSFLYNIKIVKALVGQKVKQAKTGEYGFAACITERLPINRLTVQKILCTAVAVTKSHVLTAGHCVENRAKNQTQIFIGAVNLANSRIYYPLWWITFNEWSASRRRPLEFRVNDMAAIKLTEQLPNEIIPAAISPLENTELYGSKVVVLGWGITNDGEASMNLHKAALKVISNTECKNQVHGMFGQRVAVQSRNLCTVANPFALIHWGDSGGPLLYQDMVVGISKSTMPNTEPMIHPNKVNIHSGVEFYRQFIMMVTHNLFVWQ